MRYQKGIEEILRILHEFDSRTKMNMRCSTTLIGRELGKTMTLHHLPLTHKYDCSIQTKE